MSKYLLLSKRYSERISILRFPLIVGVIFNHAYDTQLSLSGKSVGIANNSAISDFIRNLISQGAARIAVPLFFLLAGYFFFLNTAWSTHVYKRKIVARIRTLLIPLILWNSLTLVFFAIAQAIPQTSTLFSSSKAPIVSYKIFDYFNAILGISRMPIAYHFWFIRDLFLITLLSPGLYLLLKHVPKLALFSLYLLWFLNIWPIYIPSISAVTFFYTGAFVSYFGRNLFLLDRHRKIIVLTYLSLLIFDTAFKSSQLNPYIHRIGLLFGIVASLCISDKLCSFPHIKKILLWASSTSFFVFAIHEPLLMIARKLIYKTLVPQTNTLILILYFVVPIIIIATSLIIREVLRLALPKVLGALSGGRTAESCSPNPS